MHEKKSKINKWNHAAHEAGLIHLIDRFWHSSSQGRSQLIARQDVVGQMRSNTPLAASPVVAAIRDSR
jgi:hypothetical protein